MSLGNGDELDPFDQGDQIGVVERWEWPGPHEEVTVANLRAVQKIVSEGEWRADAQCGLAWVGAAIAQALGTDLENKAHRETINKCLKTWLSAGMLKKVTKKDKQRKDRAFVEVGEMGHSLTSTPPIEVEQYEVEQVSKPRAPPPPLY